MNKEKEQAIATLGVILFVLIIGPVIMILFPETRDGALMHASNFLLKSLGVELPVIDIGTKIVKVFYVAIVMLIFMLGGLAIAAFLKNVLDVDDTQLGRWAAVASLIGLAISISTLIGD